jgi:hypothetical protein
LRKSGELLHDSRMTDAADQSTRFEILLSRQRRRELAELAAKLELSSADLARLGIVRLLQNPGALLGRGSAQAARRKH